MQEHLRSEHLLLLIGGNPLPNAIAGKLLLKPKGTLTLVHSQDTIAIARRLYTWFSAQGISTIQYKEVKESEATSIVAAIRQQLQDVGASSVGLHYTGGTKAMAVHSYRAVEQWANKTKVTPVFSYLTPRELEIVFDPPLPTSGPHGHTEYVGREITVHLQDLLQLHGWKLRHEPTRQSVFPESAKALASACAADDAFTHWKEWLASELHSKCRRSNKDDWRSKTALRDIRLLFPTSAMFVEVVAALQRELQQTAESMALNALPADIAPESFCKWLNGIWLEHHVLDGLTTLAPTLHLHEWAQNIETDDVQFDMDIIALRGYQLFAFSCSTDNTKGLLKSKLFEAYIRARQLGGDEARVALVCCSDVPEKLE